MKKAAYWIENNIDLILIIIGFMVLDITVATKSFFIAGIMVGIEILIIGVVIAVLSNFKLY